MFRPQKNKFAEREKEIMAEATQDFDQMQSDASAEEETQSRSTSTFNRVAKYTLVRVFMLFITVVLGVYLTVLIANMGGYVDDIRLGAITETIGYAVNSNPENRSLTPTQRQELIEGLIDVEVRKLGLDQPFVFRSFRFLENALTMNLGFAENMTSDSGSKEVANILLERLPPTLMLWGAANLLLFFMAIFIALFLSRRYGSVPDKIVIALTPTSSAPAWFYGLFLILIFAAILQVLPFNGMVDAPVPETVVGYATSVLRHLALPVSAIVISSVFLNSYNWRTFFLIYSSEDYVEMAKAKGLSDRAIERRYVLRPTLPTIITTFALLLITLWQGAIILETVFNWPGLGRALYVAIGLYDIPVIVGSTVIYAYLLALTVFLLDFIYALVDPRVKIGSQGGQS
jgi:peptide/nickel transport system permease protein